MKNLCFIFIFLLAGIVGVNAQSNCPVDKVCITREAAIQAVEDHEAVKALKVEVATLKQAVSDEKDVSAKLKIEFAEKSGENTVLKQNAVRTDSIIDILVKNSRKKCAPFSILCL